MPLSLSAVWSRFVDIDVGDDSVVDFVDVVSCVVGIIVLTSSTLANSDAKLSNRNFLNVDVIVIVVKCKLEENLEILTVWRLPWDTIWGFKG